MKHNNQNYNLNEFTSYFEDMGFELSDNTGGQYLDIIPSISKDDTNLYEAKTFEGETITFLEPEIFLKTVTKTEKHLKVKLFT